MMCLTRRVCVYNIAAIKIFLEEEVVSRRPPST